MHRCTRSLRPDALDSQPYLETYEGEVALEGVAVLEPQHRRFRETGVADLQVRLLLRSV